MTKYILKRRTKDFGGSPNPFRPSGQWVHGPWNTVGKYDSHAEASNAIPENQSLFTEYVVFYQGKKLPSV